MPVVSSCVKRLSLKQLLLLAWLSFITLTLIALALTFATFELLAIILMSIIPLSLQRRRWLLIRKADWFVNCAIVSNLSSLISKCRCIDHREIRLLHKFDLCTVIISTTDHNI